MLKRFLLFLGSVFMALTLGMIVLLIINPTSRQEENRPGSPLRIYLDTSISFYEQQSEAIKFVEELQEAWKFPIELYPFAYDVESARLLNQENPELIRSFERQTRFGPLETALKFVSPQEPKVVISDFIFNDFFTPELDERLFLYKLGLSNATNDFSVFIENRSSDYQPNAFQALSEENKITDNYPLTMRISLYANQVPLSGMLTLKTLAPYKAVLYQKPVQLTNRWETISVPVTVRPLPTLTVEATLAVNGANSSRPIRVRDSLNLIGDNESIPIALFIFKPYKDISLIKRTFKRYGLFSVKAYTFLRNNRERLSAVKSQYEAYLNELTKKGNTGGEPLFLVMGADEEVLDFFRNQKQTFINFPKIERGVQDSSALASQTLVFEHDFLNLTGNRATSMELWKKAAPFMRTHSQPLPKNATSYQQNPDGSSFLFRNGKEMYVGINSFYELNRSLIASANFSDADVFWVRLLEKLHKESTDVQKKDYLHNYFLGEPINDAYLTRTLKRLVKNDSGNSIIPPIIQYAGAYPLSNAYYHYRVDLREYYPLYDFDETLFASKEQILTSITEISEDYEQDKIITIRPLRSYQLPYILVLVFFLGYLLSKWIHSRV